MKGDDYAFALGKLYGNLKAIETSVRLFLSRAEQSSTDLADPDTIKAGDKVPASPFTHKRDMRALLDAYNGLAPADLHVDADVIVAIQEALAHSRAHREH